ncbi:MAG: site-2 protease family protein [Bdellovibrionales bacterium]
MDIVEIGGRLALFFIPFLFALCIHEFAHGLVAKWRGDNTAEAMGRLTLNPMAHADPIGTFALPIAAIVFNIPIFFGWAKPVPVDTRSLKNPRVDMFWIALAGPLSNVLMAILAAVVMALVMRFVPAQDSTVALKNILDMFILVNLFLAVFNLIPLHPLDGGKVIARFLPAQWNYWLERNENITGIVLLMLIISGFLAILRIPVMYAHAFLTSWAY